MSETYLRQTKSQNAYDKLQQTNLNANLMTDSTQSRS